MDKIQAAKTLVKATSDRLEFKLFMLNVFKNNLVLCLRFGKVFLTFLKDRATLESNPAPKRVIEALYIASSRRHAALIRALTC